LLLPTKTIEEAVTTRDAGHAIAIISGQCFFQCIEIK